MTGELEDRDPLETSYDCAACGGEDSLIEGWDDDARFQLTCGECGAVVFPDAE